MATRLIFGCGYLGRRVAQRWAAAGDTVFAATRSEATGRAFAEQGLQPRIADVTRPESLTDLPAVDTLVYAVGYDRSAEPSIHEVYAEGLRNVLAAASTSVQRAIYISTTGVYGDAGGDWVHEQTPSAPARDGGKASLAAERVLAESAWGDRSVALRMAGLYGPDRIPYLKQLRAGEPIAAPSEGWLNLIHIDDAATAVLASAEASDPPPLVNVSDGAPPQRGDYYAEVARQIGAPPPRFVEPAADSPRAARAAANKRVGNRLLVERLGVSLAYPTYREGVAAALG
ncbi:NAD dependent epimerase/dehydratase family protein [Planctomycetes bacterium MalM25]|nr:NAD dependent epimerase/dehydratase family protein [Planctomycetes bacterium MalM25]